MKKIAILGGGGAGWLTALFIKQIWSTCDVTVIEDPNTPPIIAGESGSASFNKLLNFLEIPFDEWIQYVNAMPKLGGTLTNWNGAGSKFIHGLIPEWYRLEYNGKFPEYGKGNDFLACALAENIPMERVFYNGYLQTLGKLPLVPSTTEKFNTLTLPMWHFDSRANADYMKARGLSKNIKLVEGKYLSCSRNDQGDIISVNLDTQQIISADWFFDCSGFSRLLLQKELGESFKDLSDYFPARAVVAWWDKPELKNYTGLNALKYGWSWNINLRHRAGNGYIYDPDRVSVDEVIAEAEQYYNTKIEPQANLKFSPGIFLNCWKNNVIAIGLSSGFLEPLESNGLSAIVEQLRALEEYWSPVSNTAIEQNLFNKKYQKIMFDISDFLSLHYRGKRSDTDFWQDHNSNPNRISDSLKEKLDMWKAGFIGIDDTDVYGLENYMSVMQGLDLVDKTKLRQRLLAKRPTIFEDFNQSYQKLSIDIDNIANICYSLEDWVRLVYENN